MIKKTSYIFAQLFFLISCQGKIDINIPSSALRFDLLSVYGSYAAGNLISFDFNVNGDDTIDTTSIIYTCYVDNTISNSVDDTTLCSSIIGLNFNSATGELSWTPTISQSGTYEFKVIGQVGDKIITTIFSFEVKTNPPVIDPISNQTTAENTAITSIDAADGGDDLDSDGEPITYSCYYDTTLNGSVATTNLCTDLGATFNTSTGVMDWTPSYSQAGTYEFRIIGSDGHLSDDEIFVITVANTNQAPVLDPIADQAAALENTAITTIDAADGGDDFDVDTDALTYSCYYDTTADDSVASINQCSAIGATFNASTGAMNWTPSYTQAGTYEFKITGSDGSLSDEEIFVVTVANTNRAPVLDTIIDQAGASENSAITTINAADGGDDFDADGDAITYSCYYDTLADGAVASLNLCSSLGATFNTSTGVMNWTPSYSQAGTYEFKITGSDGSLSDDEIFVITVANTNQAPTLDAIADQAGIEANSAITSINAADSGDDFDADGQALTYSCYYDTTTDGVVTNTNLCTTLGASFNSTTGVLNWTPSLTQVGTYEFKIIGSDGTLFDDELFTIGVSFPFTKFTASDPIIYQDFAKSVSISGTNILIGAPIDEPDGLVEAGSAYLYRIDPATETYIETKITASDKRVGDFFGGSISISGNTLLVGAINCSPDGTGDGCAYLYQLNPTTGAYIEKKIEASDSTDGVHFGTAVSISGNNFIVGTSDWVTGGHIYSYRIDPATGSYVETKITSSDWFSGTGFGSVLSLTGDNILAGDPAGSYMGITSGCVYLFRYDLATNSYHETKIGPSDGSAGDKFGSSVAISENNLLVGAEYKDGIGVDSGSAYLYRLNPSTNSYIETKIVASDTHEYSFFGKSVGISGNNFVVGANYSLVSGIATGAAYFYQINPISGNISETKIIDPEGQFDDEFGASVAISGDNIIVGSYCDDGALQDTGSAFLYEAASISTEVTFTSTTKANWDNYGTSVSISGNNILVGSSQHDVIAGDAGAAFLYRFDKDTASYVETMITASDAASGDYFGNSVSIDGNNFVIGSPDDDDLGGSSGSAYFYRLSPVTYTYEETKLTASDGAATDKYGTSVGISGTSLIIGSYRDDDLGSDSGSAYIYQISPSTGTFIETKLRASDGAASDNFGIAVSISGENIIVGADRNDDGGSSSGSAYLFRRDPTSGSYVETKFTASDAAATNYYGGSVSISGDQFIVGALGATDFEGKAYLYQIDPATGMYNEKILVPSDPISSGYFGSSVSISDGNILVGAYGANGSANYSGAAYLYRLIPNSSNYFETKITASDSDEYDNFGYSVGISGDNLLIGANYRKSDGITSGGAYLIPHNLP